MFLQFELEKLDNHLIQLEWHLISNYTPFTITILIVEEYFQTKKHMIVKNSNKEKLFIKKLIRGINIVNTSDLLNSDLLEISVLNLTYSMERIWEKYSKVVNITKHSKSWWDDNCKCNLDIYRSTKHIEDWKQFKRTVVMNLNPLSGIKAQLLY